MTQFQFAIISEKGRKPCIASVCQDGFTACEVAMQQNHTEVVEILKENEQQQRSRSQLPALHAAAKEDDVKTVRLLLEADHNVLGLTPVS